MKPLIPITAIILLSQYLCHAQISISDADMPGINDTFRLSITNDFGLIDVSQTGANHTWNYSSFIPISQRVDTFVDPLLTSPFYYLSFTNFLDPDHFASVASPQQTPDSNNSPIQIEEVFNFFKNASTAYDLVGFGAQITGFPTPIPVTFDPVDRVYEFPLDFNNTSVSESGFGVAIPGIGYYGQSSERNNSVDGWGSLTTPYGTYDVLRVKSEINTVDTLYTDSLGFGFSFPRPTKIEYKWLAENEGVPLLQVEQQVSIFGTVTTSVVYRDSVRTSVIPPISINDKLIKTATMKVFPNPTSDVVFVDLKMEVKEDGELKIMDLSGKVVMRKKATTSRNIIDVSGIPQGNYMIELLSSSYFEIQPLVVIRK